MQRDIVSPTFSFSFPGLNSQRGPVLEQLETQSASPYIHPTLLGMSLTARLPNFVPNEKMQCRVQWQPQLVNISSNGRKPKRLDLNPRTPDYDFAQIDPNDNAAMSEALNCAFSATTTTTPLGHFHHGGSRN
jgi:hypothetical protein